MTSYEPPLQITISLPSKFVKTYGPESTGHYGGNLRVRCTDKEYELVRELADDLQISIACFTRSCAVQVARILQKHKLDQHTSMMAGDIQDEG